MRIIGTYIFGLILGLTEFSGHYNMKGDTMECLGRIASGRHVRETVDLQGAYRVNEKEPEHDDEDEKTPPKNPLYGKFDEMVDAALVHRPPEKRILFRKQAKSNGEDEKTD